MRTNAGGSSSGSSSSSKFKCNNCGKMGHYFYYCKFPITSFGIVLLQRPVGEKEYQYLMIRRKDSYGFIDFVRGKYSPLNTSQMQSIIDQMSETEKQKVTQLSYPELWSDMWCRPFPATSTSAETSTSTSTSSTSTSTSSILVATSTSVENPLRTSTSTSTLVENPLRTSTSTSTSVENPLRTSTSTSTLVETSTVPRNADWPLHPPPISEETYSAEKKFRLVQRVLPELVKSSTTDWQETEWEFPKGRKNGGEETDLACALREFEEETGIPSTRISVFDNVVPYEEIYEGTNHKPYRHKYFLALLKTPLDDIDLRTSFQATEVSLLAWKSFAECMRCIRPYHTQKKEMVERIHETMKETEAIVLL